MNGTTPQKTRDVPAKAATPAEAFAHIENAAYLRDAAWISSKLEEAQKSRFYGKIVLNMEAGLCVRIVKEESIKPPHRE